MSGRGGGEGGAVNAPREITRETLLRLAEAAGIRIAREHRPGVIRNLDLMLAQADVLGAGALDPLAAPASSFRP